MLRVAVGTTPLRAEHERLLRTALRRGENRPERRPGERIDEGYAPAARMAAIRVWRGRMVNEHRSAAVFSRLLPQLMEAEATLDVKTACMRMAMDELRHGALCGDVVEALGEAAEADVDLATAPLPSHPGCTPLERALRNVLYVGCLSETIAVALTTEERAQTTDPLVRRVIDQIVADEVLHAKFGWCFLAEAWPALDPDARARTNGYLRVAFAHVERNELACIPLAPPTERSIQQDRFALGVCDTREARGLLYETIRDVILPQLEAHGLDAVRAWSERAVRAA